MDLIHIVANPNERVGGKMIGEFKYKGKNLQGKSAWLRATKRFSSCISSTVRSPARCRSIA
jgi:hypothetical protein